jgi:hypothetical protein
LRLPGKFTGNNTSGTTDVDFPILRTWIQKAMSHLFA